MDMFELDLAEVVKMIQAMHVLWPQLSLGQILKIVSDLKNTH